MGRHSRTHLILPLIRPIEPVTPAPDSPRDRLRARYASTLIDVLAKRIAETGELDEALADKIELLLWPLPPPPSPETE